MSFFFSRTQSLPQLNFTDGGKTATLFTTEDASQIRPHAATATIPVNQGNAIKNPDGHSSTLDHDERGALDSPGEIDQDRGPSTCRRYSMPSRLPPDQFLFSRPYELSLLPSALRAGGGPLK